MKAWRCIALHWHDARSGRRQGEIHLQAVTNDEFGLEDFPSFKLKKKTTDVKLDLESMLIDKKPA